MSKENKEKISEEKVSRRSMLRWTAALAGAAVGGAVVGVGADMLVRPTQGPATGTTVTVTSPPPSSLSYKPPLSAEVQDRVNKIIQDSIALHEGEKIVYTSCNQGCMMQCLLKVRAKNGRVTSIETDDSVNPNNPREDVDLAALKKGRVQSRPCAMGVGWREKVYGPDRLLYPMKNVGGKGDRKKFVRISWTEALDTIWNKMAESKEKYGP
ncbi:MAG: molybdopterin-dependent oxidoreductase, partial [Candidatus Bathyarchaeia archaeon]